MRRYGTTSDATVVPGKDAGIKLVLQPLAEAVECADCAEIAPCEPSVTGLFWFSDSTGLFDQEAEAAYLLAEGAAGPLLGIAKLVGEPCDLPVTWAKDWTPATGTGGDPGYLEGGASLIVYPIAGTAPGTLDVTAEHGGQTYGPIALTVEMYVAAQWVQKFDNTFWGVEASYGGPWLSWTGSDWDVGYQPYANSMWLGVIGSWAVGYRPQKARVEVVTSADNGIQYTPSSISVVTESGSTLGVASLTMTPGNTYSFECDLNFSGGNDIGGISVYRVAGDNNGVSHTRITNIEFLE